VDRPVILVAAAVLFGFGLLLAFLLCRSGNNEEVAAPRAPADPTTTMTQPAEPAR
jgi:hypothetical protein